MPHTSTNLSAKMLPAYESSPLPSSLPSSLQILSPLLSPSHALQALPSMHYIPANGGVPQPKCLLYEALALLGPCHISGANTQDEGDKGA